MSENSPDSDTATLGLGTLVCMVVANMIGAGIFQSSGYSMAALGDSGRVMLAWWLCGLWAICGALAYGALVSRLPMSGGEYLFLHRFVHPSAGFLAGWISLVAGFTAPIALNAKSAASAAAPSASPLVQNCLATLIIAIAAICYLRGLNIGARVQNAIVIIKLAVLVAVILFAFSMFNRWSGGGTLPDRTAGWMPESAEAWSQLLGSMSWVALSYTGFNAAIYVAGQSRNASTIVPQSMLVGTIIVTVLYLVLNAIFVYSTPIDLVAGSGDQVSVVVSQHLGGGWLKSMMQWAFILAMLTSVFSMLMAGPHVYRQMARDKAMPGLLDGQGYTPVYATILQATLSCVVVFTTGILDLMKYLGLTLSLCGLLAVISLWWVRKRLPDSRPLAWWEQTSTAIYVVITIAILWASRTQQPAAFLAMTITFGVGIAVYGLWVAYETIVKRSSESTPRT